ncbi:MAG: ABC transporter permease [Ottowia sp.]|jgi:phospholipid/cholesterol/gamma-HCH transport system permease protein|nr:ABC transporter permease [Ottowia sp.]MBP7458563.1 ABC transporter permease [Ottowia sp.]MBP8161516.1 ABC transporter permease [Ottowia sp.]MBP8860671.1 ABC transporter permease [Ottowia sp.]MBP9523203.1 ABC transporter permease [Ottowia sp.]
MTTGFSLYGWLIGLGQGVLRWLFGWWTVVFIGAQLAVLAFSPSSYGAEARGAVLRQIYHAAGPGLPGFTTLMALFNVVLIRILVVTAFAYGLTQYALDAVVRVLVLELIPLIAALFVAVEYTIPGGSELYKLRRSGALQALRERGVEPLSHEVLPRVLAGLFAVLLLAALSCFLSLVLAYIAVHGFTLAGVPSYNHAVGNIFNPVVSLIFSMKTLLFAIAVALLPVANALRDIPRRASRTSVELQGLVQMFVLMLVIEIASLIGNYY